MNKIWEEIQIVLMKILILMVYNLMIYIFKDI